VTDNFIKTTSENPQKSGDIFYLSAKEFCRFSRMGSNLLRFFPPPSLPAQDNKKFKFGFSHHAKWLYDGRNRRSRANRKRHQKRIRTMTKMKK
jgi:hypothetical protein